MELSAILIFIVAALIIALLVPGRWRSWALMIVSLIAIYALQPTLAIPWLDYSLPTATLLIIIAVWLFTRPQQPFAVEDKVALGISVVLALLLTLPRYVTLPFEVTSRPPDTLQAALIISLTLILIGAAYRFVPSMKALVITSLLGLVALFVVLKTEPLTILLSTFLRQQAGRDVTLASAIDLNWLGFSYVAFRLIHTLRDWQTGLLPALTLREYLNYVIFFPAYTAGPIDRVERFLQDERGLATQNGQDAARILEGFQRIGQGLFKKFVIADSLALFSLNPTMAQQADSTGGLWVMLYAYAFRLLFDFSGYTDIAIGIGLLLGIRLPENFDRPYLKNTITAFWQSWHMTLSNWVRFYVYSPLTRNLLRRKHKPSNNIIILLGTLATMVVIGLWHGVTIPFLIWGLWHGTGLFVHKIWSDHTRRWYRGLNEATKRAWTVGGVVITFHFVALGWVWFVIPDVGMAAQVLLRLLGGTP